MAYHRPGRGKIASRCSEKSSIASGYSTPSFSARRFDHLIEEQQTLVRNAQEALKQSLSILQRGSSKEEQDSARLQVDALLTRCGELLTKLQVVTAIRKELATTQSEITESRKRRKGNVTQLQHRQQWLEKRLQGLLLSRYRGRPAARGRRTVLPVVNFNGGTRGGMAEGKAEYNHGVMEEQPQRVYGRGSKPSRFTGRVLAHQRRQSNVTTISDITTVYTMSIPSSAGHVMKDSDEDNSETDSQMTSDDFSSDEASSTTEQNLAQDLSTNTKKQEDSDEWYSESEANWTIMDVQSKQVTPSQPCSSIEEDTAKTRTIKSPSGGESVPCTPVEESSNGHLILINQKEKITSTKTTERLRISSQQTGSEPWYGFERPRSAKLFGPESWNTLSLARFTNYVETRSSTERKSQHITTAQEVELVDLIEEVAALSQQVQAVAKAVVEGGRTAPPSRGLQRSSSVPAGGTRCSRTGSDYNTRALTTAETFKLPSLKQNKLSRITFQDPDSMYEPSGITGRPSRKIFAREGMEQVYPQPVSRWNKVQTTTDCLLTDQPIQLLALPYRSKGQKQSTHNRSNTTQERTNIEDQIAFEAEKHRAQRLQLLKERLSSSITDVRADTVQALGFLSPDQDIIQAMIKLLVKDPQPQVRFEALKSLIKMGIINGTVLKIMTAILKNGTIFCQHELLSVLGTDSAIMCLKQKANGPDVQQELHDVLLQLMMGSSCDEHISLTAANILSCIAVYKSICREYLIANCLKSKNTLCQYNALCCLAEHHDTISDEMVEIAFSHMSALHDWKQRLRAVNILKSAGSVVVNGNSRDTVQEKLMKRLPNEPILAVRKGIGELIGKLRMTEQVEAKLMKKLENGNEVERRQVIVSLAALQLKERSILNILLDSLELDPSVHVKVQAVRVLSTFQPTSTAVLSCLQRKAQGTGTLAQESSRALLILNK